MKGHYYSRVLRKSISNRFYEENALFFFIAIGVAGGMMPAYIHVALAAFFAGNPVFTLIPAGLWVLYTAKLDTFNMRILQEPSMTFVHQLGLASTWTKIRVLALVAFTELIPIIVYGVFLIITAFQTDTNYFSVFAVVFELTSLFTVTTLRLYNSIQNIRENPKTNALWAFLNQTLARSFPQMFLELQLRTRLGVILFSKAFNCLLLLGICVLFKYDTYDLRLLAMGCAITWATSMEMVHQYVNFENHTLNLTRNLPISLVKRMMFFITIFILINIPEYLVIARNFPDVLTSLEFVTIAVLGLSIQAFSYCFLLKSPMQFDRFAQIVFAFTLGIVASILFRFPLYLLILVAAGISTYWYPRYFYKYQD